MIFVKIDDSALQAWAQKLAARGLKSGLAEAVNAAARDARNKFIDAAQQDVGGAAAKVRRGVSPIRRATESTLTASFSAKAVRISVRETKGFKASKKGGIAFSTHRLTGGKSTAAIHPHSFVVKGKYVAYRTGKARLPIRAMHAEHPGTAMGQEGAAPRKVFEQTATDQVRKAAEAAVQKALNGA